MKVDLPHESPKNKKVIRHYSKLFLSEMLLSISLRFAILFWGMHVSVEIDNKIVSRETADNPLELGDGHSRTASDAIQQ